LALRGAEAGGAATRMFDGGFLGELPMYRSPGGLRGAPAAEFLDLVSRADGLIIATPSYHGGVSALVKNALDHLEDLRDDARPYLDRRAVGCVVTAAGHQAGGMTLCALRSIVHSLRGWPTSLGVTVNTASADGGEQSVGRLHTVGLQVAEFAAAFGMVPVAGAAT
jgi:FMN reductase